MGLDRKNRIKEAKTIYEAIELLNKQQLINFSAVVAWFQIHENNNYFLVEKYNTRLFIDICVRYLLTKRKSNIYEARRNVINYIMKNYREDMEEKIIELAVAAANNASLDELYKIGRNPILVETDEGVDEIYDPNPEVPSELVDVVLCKK